MTHSATMVLADDGTLDTVIQCTVCGQQQRFNVDDTETYDAFVQWAIDTATYEHDADPAEDDS